MEEKFKQIIDSSSRILISSHIGPDGDSVSSSLLLKAILTENYPEKNVEVNMEETPYGLDFLAGIDQLRIQPLHEALNGHKPDLFIMLDANNISRLSRTPDIARKYLSDNSVKVVIIDHHEKVNIEDNDVFINNLSPAVTLDVYEILLEKLELKKPAGYAQLAITGIYTDTGGFVHRNINYARTFEVVPKLIADGADIEYIANKISVISERGLSVFKEFINNLHLESGYSYTYLSDETASDASHENIEAIKQAADLIRSGFLRTIGNRNWGYIVYKDCLASQPTYSASFRSLTGRDVSEIAVKLGGGGHKPAAGAKFPANNVEEALAKVKATIENTSNS